MSFAAPTDLPVQNLFLPPLGLRVSWAAPLVCQCVGGPSFFSTPESCLFSSAVRTFPFVSLLSTSVFPPFLGLSPFEQNSCHAASPSVELIPFSTGVFPPIRVSPFIPTRHKLPPPRLQITVPRMVFLFQLPFHSKLFFVRFFVIVLGPRRSPTPFSVFFPPLHDGPRSPSIYGLPGGLSFRGDFYDAPSPLPPHPSPPSVQAHWAGLLYPYLWSAIGRLLVC